jgi:hypothetical protein
MHVHWYDQRYLPLFIANGVADLVVLDADPIDDIHNTQRISSVIMSGRYYPREELDRMLARVEAIARQ